MSDPADEERRESPRFPADVRCWVGDGRGVERFARLADVSERGVRVLTTAPPAVGSRVSLRFKLPPVGDEVEADALVMWRREEVESRAGAMGLQFDRVLGRETIQAYSEELQRGESR
ncbi:MAG: PilZ domain-containing protein [Myxococcota bacterium]